MTEVPEHLLQRSRERREALGLGGDGGGEGSTAPATTGAAPAPAAAESAEASAVEQAPAPEPVAVPAAPPRPRPPATRVPAWVVPVLAGLPLWGFLYMGSFGSRATGPVAPNGAQIYSSAGCAGCHGGAGEGGVGPALNKGETKLTFPNEADHIAWIETGSTPFKGKPYGDPARGRVAKTGGMPGFKGTLTDEQIRAVVVYERDL